jgi:hypothetical protein
MTKHIFISLLAFTLVLSANASFRKGDIVITPISHPNYNHTHGYIENRMRIDNTSLTKTHTVHLQAPAYSYSYSSHHDYIGSVERTTTIAPHSSIIINLPIPALPINGNNNVVVVIDGKKSSAFNMESMADGISHRGSNIYSIYTSRAFNAQSMIDAINKKSATSHGIRSHLIQRSEDAIQVWSHNWLAYSCYDTILLHRDDIAVMPQAVQDALHQYVSVGGTIAITGTHDFPFNWKHSQMYTNNNAHAYASGFGKILAFDKEKTENFSTNSLRLINNMAKTGATPWTHNYYLSHANKIFPIIENINLPTRSLFLILLVFSIFSGPVLLIILARKNRRIWLLWLAPAISLAVCTAITVYSVFSEGTTPTARTESVTILNQHTHQAATIGMLGLYCPLTPGKGLHFTPFTEISLFTKSSYRERGTAKTINWTHDQNLARGWVSARVPLFFQIRIPQMRRERLEFARKNGQLSVANFLGAPIKKLWVCDENGNLSTTPTTINNRAGGDLIADLAQINNAHDHDRIRQIYTSPYWPKEINTLASDYRKILKPNMYLAILDGDPFLQTGLSGQIHKKSKSIVIGILAPAKGTH